MIWECGFCQQLMEKLDHVNKDLFDVYKCDGCIKGYDTRYYQVFYAGESELLAAKIRIDEYFIVRNYSFNYTNRRTKYTTIFKKIIGSIDSCIDLAPITWGPDMPVCDIDFVVDFDEAMLDPAALKKKLAIYTTFS